MAIINDEREFPCLGDVNKISNCGSNNNTTATNQHNNNINQSHPQQQQQVKKRRRRHNTRENRRNQKQLQHNGSGSTTPPKKHGQVNHNQRGGGPNKTIGNQDRSRSPVAVSDNSSVEGGGSSRGSHDAHGRNNSNSSNNQRGRRNSQRGQTKRRKNNHKSPASSQSSLRIKARERFVREYEMREQWVEEQMKMMIAANEHFQKHLISMDCEMVGVGTDGSASALARISIVDHNGEVVLDQYVKPDQPVTDYRTFVSGITKADLSDDTKTIGLDECREKVSALLDGKILVGHGLESDLQALGIDHPWQLTRDTAHYEPYMKRRFENDNALWPRRLRDLSIEYLSRSIQEPGEPHSPVEDALAALDLYKLVQPHFEQMMNYKMWEAEAAAVAVTEVDQTQQQKPQQ